MKGPYSPFGPKGKEWKNWNHYIRELRLFVERRTSRGKSPREAINWWLSTYGDAISPKSQEAKANFRERMKRYNRIDERAKEMERARRRRKELKNSTGNSNHSIYRSRNSARPRK